MPAQSLLNGTLSEAIEGLAKRAVVARRLRGLQKEAFGIEDMQSAAQSFGNTLQGYGQQGLDMARQGFDSMQQQAGPMLEQGMQWAGDNPELAGGLLGAGGGALMGGLSTLGQEPEDRNYGHNMMTGAMAGGALGLGGGLLARHAPQLAQQPPEADIVDQVNQAIQRLEEQAAASGPDLARSAATMSPVTGGVIAADMFNPGHVRAGAQAALREKNPLGFDPAGLRHAARENSPWTNFKAQFGKPRTNQIGNLNTRDVGQLRAMGRGPLTAKNMLGRAAAYSAPTLLHYLSGHLNSGE